MVKVILWFHGSIGSSGSSGSNGASESLCHNDKGISFLSGINLYEWKGREEIDMQSWYVKRSRSVTGGKVAHSTTTATDRTIMFQKGEIKKPT